MFHIKPDKRSQTSAALLVDGLYQCMKEKPFSSITITDVQKASTVGRATFYRLFDALPDVLEYQCDLIFGRIIENYPSLTDSSAYDALVFFFREWMEQELLLNAIFTSNHLEILYGVFRKYAPMIRAILSPDANLTEEEVNYAGNFISLGMVGTLESWMKEGKERTPEELADFFQKTIETVYLSF